MAGTASFPWMEETRNQVQNLQEWKDFTAKLYDAVTQQMNESSISMFTDLSESEKVFVLEKAAKALNAGDIYNKLSARISSCLEENLYTYVAYEVQNSDIPKSQSDLISKHIQDGVISILDRRPDLKMKLHILFNQPLPVSLRTLVWRLQLSNTKARMEYLTQESMNKARSVMDGEIHMKCQDVLSQEQTFQHLRDIKNIDRTMRNVLSYHHKLHQMKESLPEEDYRLLLPLIQSVMDTQPLNSPSGSISATLVEEYVSFMNSRPTVMKGPCNDNRIFQEIAQLLEKHDRDLAHKIRTIYTSQNSAADESLLSGICKMLLPVLRVFFVGYLNMNTLMYVWDQYIIGLDQPAYNCLPAISFTFLTLLHGHLDGCSSHHEIEAVLKTYGPTLSVQEFQMIINQYFYTELPGILAKGESSPYSVYDPTQAIPQWSHLSRATVPPRIRPQDKRRVREEREMHKKETAEKQQREDEMRLVKEDLQKRQERDKLNMLLEDAKGRFETEKAQLENQLKQEQQKSYEFQKKAEKHINELQDEIRHLMQRRKISVGGQSVDSSLFAPPPSVNSQTSRQSSNLSTAPEQKAD